MILIHEQSYQKQNQQSDNNKGDRIEQAPFEDNGQSLQPHKKKLS